MVHPSFLFMVVLGSLAFIPSWAQQYPGGYGGGPYGQQQPTYPGGSSAGGQDSSGNEYYPRQDEGQQGSQQQGEGQQGEPQLEGRQPGGKEGAEEDYSTPTPVETPSGPMSLGDAKVNFAAVVQSYLAERSSRGYWLLRSKGQTLRLHLEEVDEGSIRKVRMNRFSARVRFREASGKRLEVPFTVDFSGPRWRVVKVGAPMGRLAKGRRRPKSPTPSGP